MTPDKAMRLMGVVIFMGGLALLALAASAASRELYSVAAFIGASGLSLVCTVVWVEIRGRIRSQATG